MPWFFVYVIQLGLIHLIDHHNTYFQTFGPSLAVRNGSGSQHGARHSFPVIIFTRWGCLSTKEFKTCLKEFYFCSTDTGNNIFKTKQTKNIARKFPFEPNPHFFIWIRAHPESSPRLFSKQLHFMFVEHSTSCCFTVLTRATQLETAVHGCIFDLVPFGLYHVAVV